MHAGGLAVCAAWIRGGERGACGCEDPEESGHTAPGPVSALVVPERRALKDAQNEVSRISLLLSARRDVDGTGDGHGHDVGFLIVAIERIVGLAIVDLRHELGDAIAIEDPKRSCV